MRDAGWQPDLPHQETDGEAWVLAGNPSTQQQVRQPATEKI
jgi:hypothetical protein